VCVGGWKGWKGGWKGCHSVFEFLNCMQRSKYFCSASVTMKRFMIEYCGITLLEKGTDGTEV
jgi:hypothetical protein